MSDKLNAATHGGPALDPDLLMLRRAVAKLMMLHDQVIWQALGLPLSETLAKVEGSFLTGQKVELDDAQRYVVEHIDEAISSFRLIKEMNT